MKTNRLLIAAVAAGSIGMLAMPTAYAATVPGAPSNVSAQAGDASATVSWTAPASSGDSAIISYSVTASPGGRQAHVGDQRRSATVTGLTNGTSYTFTVHATNDAGNSPESGPSNAVTPRASTGLPGAPTAVGASPGDGSASVSWTAPSSVGASAITSYAVTSSPGGRTKTVNGSSRSATVDDLTNGTSYTFTVKAVNGSGTGPASAPSAAITVGAPRPPTNLTVAPGDRRATVSWSPPANNGARITAYTVAVSPGTKTVSVDGSTTSATITGLTNGTSYTFTVRATNSRGTGPASSVSATVRPATVNTVRRLAGASRIETAIALSQDTWATASSGATSTHALAQAVVLTRSDQFADALAGTPLAAAKVGPLLLTPPAGLDGDVRTEIGRVLAEDRTVYVLGGTAAISAGTVSLLESDGYRVVRLAGRDRFATAVDIADDGLDNPGTQLLVTGLDFPDALAAGAAATQLDGAVLLTNGHALETSTRSYLDDHPGTRYSIGGQAVDAYPSGQAVAGTDRYDTAVRVARRFFGEPAQVGIASGQVFADALTGSVHIARRSGPMLLVGSSLPPVVRAYLVDERQAVSTAHVYGGASAVPESVLDSIRTAIT